MTRILPPSVSPTRTPSSDAAETTALRGQQPNRKASRTDAGNAGPTSAASQGDRVTLSHAASASAASADASTLDEAGAAATSVSLRGLLNTQKISADARQNESILSLLR